jgi:acetylornithine deacetylase/succinyl-diaminopimelate desuccinylase-like protein
MLPQWVAQDSGARAGLGVDRWIDGMTPHDALIDYLFNTTLNVDGIWAGYTGPGMKTILPHVATAKMDSRLVPDQDPDSQLALIRAHLDAKGFKDITLRKLSGYPPAQSSVSAPLVRAAIGAYNKYGFPPSVAPRWPAARRITCSPSDSGWRWWPAASDMAQARTGLTSTW